MTTTRFLVNNEVFIGNGDLEECYAYYEEHFKPFGFILNKDNEDVYLILDRHIVLNEGDRVDLYGTRLVAWKCLNPIKDEVTYYLKEE